MITREGPQRWRVYEGGRERLVIGARYRAEEAERELGAMRAADARGAAFRRIERIVRLREALA